MALTQSVERALQSGIGEGGVPGRAYLDQLRRAEEALIALRAAHDNGSLPLLALPFKTDDLVPLATTAGANFITGRDVHVFPGWVVVVGVAVSLVIANIANDRVSASAAKMGEAVGKYLPIGRAGDGK